MTPENARRILGIGPQEDPRTQFAELEQARARIAALVETAPNAVLVERYRKGLADFDEALATLRDPPAAVGPEPPAVIAEAEPPAATAPTKHLDDPPAAPPPRRGRGLSFFVWFLVFLVGVAGGTLLYLRNEQAKAEQLRQRVEYLEREGAVYIENRRWEEAEASFNRIEAIAPGVAAVSRGRSRIAEGKADEQRQAIGYLIGHGTAELEAGRLDEAAAAAQRVLGRVPGEPEATALLAKVETARLSQARDESLAAARAALDRGDWDAATAAAEKVLATYPGDADATAIAADAEAGRAKAAADQARARELFLQAQPLDQGVYDQTALDLLREAAALAPDDAEIAALLEKFASYTRTLRVPGDFETAAAAVAAARDRDRVVLAAGTWAGPLVVTAAIELQGAGAEETIVECPPDEGSAISIGPEAKGARISGLTFRHSSFAVGDDRFSAALVRGGSAAFAECRFLDASGHGLAAIEGGQASASRCRFVGNGWNGVAAVGNGSTLEIRDCVAQENFEHGIEAWDGAAAIVTNNRCEGNSRNGIHIDSGAASATVEGNQLVANREFGLVLDSAKTGKITGNIARANLLGGFVIRTAAAGLPFATNEATANKGPGLVLEQGLAAASYASNTVRNNSGVQVMSDADLSGEPPPAAAPDAGPEAIPRAIVVPESEVPAPR